MSTPQRELLHLGHVLAAAALDESDILCLRHTFNPTSGLRTGATPTEVLAYTRRQDLRPGKIPAAPPRVWLVFAADGGARSRLLAVYENHGEIEQERTDVHRVFGLQDSHILADLVNRLVVDWPGQINWTRPGSRAHQLRIVEIADPQVVAFPGFDRVLLSYAELQALVDDGRWVHWQTALSAVQGIYLIADSSTGRLYVGKADGQERIFGRWTAYAQDGHGGNVAMSALDEAHRTPQRPTADIWSMNARTSTTAATSTSTDHVAFMHRSILA